MEFLVFRLYGPLAAWGEVAVGEHRHSATFPGKSAIIGLLGAALGLRRDDTEAQQALAEGYCLAVRTEHPGDLLRDYHTTQRVTRPGKRRFYTRRDELLHDGLSTVLSQRDYRSDGHWLIALWSRPEAPYGLVDLGSALRRPVFPLYLGRKSCPPALPLNPELVESATLRAAFDLYPALPAVLADLPEQRVRHCYWEQLDDTLAGFPDAMVHARRDHPLDRMRWQFSERSLFEAIYDTEDSNG